MQRNGLWTWRAIAMQCIAALLWANTAAADTITQEIDRAKAAYLQGKLNDAKLSLDMASQLVTQQKSKLLNSVLPPPYLGWTAEDKTAAKQTGPKQQPAPQPSGSSMPSAATAVGALGGITTSRTYKKADKVCIVTVAGDSPLLTVVSMFLANPSVAQASGSRLTRIGNQRAVISQDGEVQVMSSNNFLVTVSGDCPESDKVAYAGAVDYARLSSF